MSEPNLGLDVRLAILESQLNSLNEKTIANTELLRQILSMRSDMAVQEAGHRDLKDRVGGLDTDARNLTTAVATLEKNQSSLKSWIAGAAFVGVFVSILLNWIVKTQMEPLVALPQKVMQLEYSIQQMAARERHEDAPKSKP